MFQGVVGQLLVEAVTVPTPRTKQQWLGNYYYTLQSLLRNNVRMLRKKELAH
jgi:hypothetical protein